MYQPIDIANWFLGAIDREAGDSITHLKLQKLVYYAQAWSLTLWNKPLFQEDFEAWTHGPVVKSLFSRFKDYGYNVLPQPDEVMVEFDEETDYVLTQVKRVYGELSAKKLEDLTHQEDPWMIARGNLPLEGRCNNVISKESMRKYYSDLLTRVNGQG